MGVLLQSCLLESLNIFACNNNYDYFCQKIQPMKDDDYSVYDMFVNADDDILIVVNAKEDEPENPRFVYDGGVSMLFYRNGESAIVLEAINKDAREALMKVDSILVAEVENNDAVREYEAPLRKITSLKGLL